MRKIVSKIYSLCGDTSISGLFFYIRRRYYLNMCEVAFGLIQTS